MVFSKWMQSSTSAIAIIRLVWPLALNFTWLRIWWWLVKISYKQSNLAQLVFIWLINKKEKILYIPYHIFFWLKFKKWDVGLSRRIHFAHVAHYRVKVKLNNGFLITTINHSRLQKCKALNTSFISKTLLEYKSHVSLLETVFPDWKGWDDVSLHNDVILQYAKLLQAAPSCSTHNLAHWELVIFENSRTFVKDIVVLFNNLKS